MKNTRMPIRIFIAVLLPLEAGAAEAGALTLLPAPPAAAAGWLRTCYKTWLHPPVGSHNLHRMQPFKCLPSEGECYEAMERTSSSFRFWFLVSSLTVQASQTGLRI